MAAAGDHAVVDFPCGTCGYSVSDSDQAVHCSGCEVWQHANCVALSASEYAALQDESDDDPWFCLACLPISTSPTSISCFSFSLISDTDCSTLRLPCCKQRSLSLLSTNCRSLLSKMDELRLLVSSSSAPAIICLTETWLDDSVRACEVDLPNYRLFRRDRDRHGGGVAIYVLDTIPVQGIRPHSTYKLLSVELSTKTGLLHLAVVYRPPSHDTDLSLMELALGSLCLSKRSKFVLTGDFNVDISEQSSNSIVDLSSMMLGFGLHQQVSEPTRVTASTATTLDLVFCNDPFLVFLSSLSWVDLTIALFSAPCQSTSHDPQRSNAPSGCIRKQISTP